MIQEYIFNDKKHRKEIEQYEYKAVEKEIYDIDETDCWIVMFSFPGQNENTAIILSEVNNYMKKFNPIILSNECSAFFNKKLYPLFNEFERKLRKLHYSQGSGHKL